MSLSVLLAVLALLAWAWMLLWRGRFWRVDPIPNAPAPAVWPDVVALVPARNEAEVIGEAVHSLLSQDYPGRLSVIVTDDHSDDGTADAARSAARQLGAEHRLTVISSAPLPRGWAGKMWAQAQAADAAKTLYPDAELLLLTDADIGHAKGELTRMVSKLLAESRDMVSLMVRLAVDTPAERAIIPAFVFFFRLLYPFRWVGDNNRSTAAAAGGYMLIRRRTLEGIGGIAAIKGALIDDCALAAAIKSSGGSLSLDLAAETVSLRPYAEIRDLWMMIARSAYTQLGCSPLLLAGTVIAMVIGFVLPPLLALGGGSAGLPALLAWLEMSIAFAPMLRFYRLPLGLAPLLPVIAVFYLAATIDSARRHWTGRGGEWKGRHQGSGPTENL